MPMYAEGVSQYVSGVRVPELPISVLEIFAETKINQSFLRLKIKNESVVKICGLLTSESYEFDVTFTGDIGDFKM